ncbi:MAG: pyridoxal 5'-phosphate synthase glutaminase subunit PdxT [Fimbriimonadaceae bacterium]
MSQTVGVLAIQGDFQRHLEALAMVDANLRGVPVRTPEQLAQVDRLIIPGGESTTVGLLAQRFGMDQAIRERVAMGMPVWGTCMGMILMAYEIDGRPDQFTFRLLDVTVRRNAFGAQVHSFEDTVPTTLFPEPVLGVFIRAPVVTRVGADVRVLATYRDQVVGVRQGNLVGTSFHPELTSDTRFHAWFATL